MALALTVTALAVDILLAVLAFSRPWISLVVLLGALPFNGLLVQVGAQLAGLDDTGRVALAAWHDMLILGIVLAAAVAWLRSRPRRLTEIEVLVGIVAVVGLIYVVVSPVRLTAAYVYRTIYEPPMLLAALVVLARLGVVPAWLPGRAAAAMVVSGVIAALAAWPQVYLGKVAYLQTFYAEPGAKLANAFFSSGVVQVRAVGTFTSPNEFGAYLATAMALLLVPGLLRMPGWLRSASLGALGLALLLTFSRSGWLSFGVAALVVAVLARDHLPSAGDVRGWLRSRTSWLPHLPPVVLTLALATAVALTSGASTLVTRTATGTDPSSAGRPASIERGISVVKRNPLGLGLGTAGPKAVRFGESASKTRILTESWYIVYTIQVGIGGALVFAALVLAILRRLWLARRGPWARAGIAVGAGLAAGALFIPIIEDPTVATPLWAIAALGIALGAPALAGRAADPEVAVA
jgi:hypothetical protein